MASKGDIIRVSIIRKTGFGPEHYGIYDGEEGVYHFTGDKPKDATVCFTSLDDFKNGGTAFIENILCKKYDPDEIIRRAQSKVGTNFGGYNLIKNNCEHFAYWCATGVRRSSQTTDVNPQDDKRDIIEKAIDKTFEPVLIIAKTLDKILGLETEVKSCNSSSNSEKDIFNTVVDKVFEPLISLGNRIDTFLGK